MFGDLKVRHVLGRKRCAAVITNLLLKNLTYYANSTSTPTSVEPRYENSVLVFANEINDLLRVGQTFGDDF